MRSCPQCCTTYTSEVEFCALDGEQLIEDLDDPMIGQVIDRYEIVDCLGEGAMAAVYRARHQVIEREVACKVLFGEYASDRQFAERFRREAQAASMVKHPNVVEVLDFGQTEGGATFLLMELLDGHTLQEAIEAQGAFNPRRAANVIRDVAAGLKATHGAGLIHRDLKPGNIMLSADDEGREMAKILDFGVVQQFGDGRLTATGQTLGTPYYMSPEQVGGGGDLAPTSDIYSLGVVTYEMLRGQAPFRGSFGEVLIKQVTEKADALPEAGGLEILAAQMMEKDASKRPQSAEDVVATVNELNLGARVPFFAIKPGSGKLPKADSLETTTERAAPLAQKSAMKTVLRADRRATDAPLSAPSSRAPLIIAAGGAVFLVVLALFLALSGGDDPAAIDDQPVAAKKSFDLEIEGALAGRGLTLADARELRDVKPLLIAWQEAKQRGRGEDVVVASLLRAIARAPIDTQVLDAKRLRVWNRRKNAPRELAERIEAIPRDLEELSSAERSQLALELDALERALSGK